MPFPPARARSTLAALAIRLELATPPGQRRKSLLRRSLPLVTMIAVVAAIGWFVWDQVERAGYYRQRVAHVEEVLRTARPGARSAYCDRLFGRGPEYAGCDAGERRGYRLFAAAWTRGHALSTIRDQLVACLNDGQRQEGTSWTVAAECAEADFPTFDGPQP